MTSRRIGQTPFVPCLHAHVLFVGSPRSRTVDNTAGLPKPQAVFPSVQTEETCPLASYTRPRLRSFHPSLCDEICDARDVRLVCPSDSSSHRLQIIAGFQGPFLVGWVDALKSTAMRHGQDASPRLRRMDRMPPLRREGWNSVTSVEQEQQAGMCRDNSHSGNLRDVASPMDVPHT